MMTQTRYQTIDNLVANVQDKKTKKHTGNALKTVTCGLALGIISTFSPGCSSSTEPDISGIFKSYNVAYIEAKSKFSKPETRYDFAGHLMSGDITGYTQQQVADEVGIMFDGNEANGEATFGLGITDQGRDIGNGNYLGVVAFKFSDYTMQVSDIERDDMTGIKEIFPPTGGIQLSTRNVLGDDKRTMNFKQYLQEK